MHQWGNVRSPSCSALPRGDVFLLQFSENYLSHILRRLPRPCFFLAHSFRPWHKHRDAFSKAVPVQLCARLCGDYRNCRPSGGSSLAEATLCAQTHVKRKCFEGRERRRAPVVRVGGMRWWGGKIPPTGWQSYGALKGGEDLACRATWEPALASEMGAHRRCSSPLSSRPQGPVGFWCLLQVGAPGRGRGGSGSGPVSLLWPCR